MAIGFAGNGETEVPIVRPLPPWTPESGRLIGDWLAAFSDGAQRELDKSRIANRHATELVDRLLRENRAQRRLIHRALHRQAAVSARLLNWLEGDGTKPREVLADLEEILGRG